MQDHDSIIGLLKSIENNYDLSKCTIGGINFWPIIRSEIRLNILIPQPHTKSWDYKMRKSNLVSNIKLPLRQLKLKQARNKFESSTPLLNEELQFFTYPNSMFVDEIKGKKYCRYIDPYYEVISSKFKSGYFGVLGNGEGLQDTYHKINYLNLSHYHYYKELKRFMDSYSKEIHQDIEKLTSIINELNQITQDKCGVKALSPDLIEHFLFIIDHIEFFDLTFKRSKVKMIFIEDFHIYLHASLCIAAKRNNIKVVEIQHGLFDAKYYPFINTKFNYDILPDYIWCWSTHDRDLLLKENSKNFKYLKPFTGGNMWIRKFESGDMVPVSELSSEFLKMIRSKFKRIVLITLQPGYLLQPNMVEAIKNSPKDFFFLVRYHPLNTSNEEKKVIKDTLKIFDNIEIEQASSIHLYALLGNVDYHMTHSSTSVIEALLFEVPSIVTSRAGRDFYRDYVNDGVVIHCEDGLEIAKSITQGIKLNTEKVKHYKISTDKEAAISSLSSLPDFSKEFYLQN